MIEDQQNNSLAKTMEQQEVQEVVDKRKANSKKMKKMHLYIKITEMKLIRKTKKANLVCGGKKVLQTQHKKLLDLL